MGSPKQYQIMAIEEKWVKEAFAALKDEYGVSEAEVLRLCVRRGGLRGARRYLAAQAEKVSQMSTG